jgi:hypothetical protein
MRIGLSRFFLLVASFRGALGRKRAARAAVLHEATTMIELEGAGAHEVACTQARLCDLRGSSSGARFWQLVAAEIARRTGRVVPQRAVDRPGRE